MSTNRFIYFIITAFVAGNLILIFIKYNSEKNTTNLIDDNKKLLNEFNVNHQLKTVESDIAQVDSKIRGTIATNDTSYVENVGLQMAKVRSDIDQLQEIKGDQSTEQYIDQLDNLVQKKLRLNNGILEVYR